MTLEFLSSMKKIPSGVCVLGRNASIAEKENKSTSSISISSFWISEAPITQEQWEEVSKLPMINKELKPDPSFFKGLLLPVEQVSWFDAVEFCDRITSKTGDTYRLPTEAEWEYACRAGTNTKYNFGDIWDSSLVNSFERVHDKGDMSNTTETVPVKRYQPNKFGLFDMHGNVEEWCLDLWHKDINNRSLTNGDAWLDNGEVDGLFDTSIYTPEMFRVIRGGSYRSNSEQCQSTSRHFELATFTSSTIGFRIVGQF